MRCNVLISGGTGSGKTTLLNCLTGSIDNDERIITCEDSAELQLQQPHVVRLETRPPNLEGEGEITMRDLVRNCLRMRPERIIVGEVRGPEAFDLLQAMNTGHDGSMGTLHANSPREAISRLESMIMMGGFALPPKTIREMITGSIDVIIQASRLRDGSRKITHITEVVGMEGEVVTLQNLIVFEITGEDAQGKIIGRHRSTGIARPRFWERAEYYGETDRVWRRRCRAPRCTTGPATRWETRMDSNDLLLLGLLAAGGALDRRRRLSAGQSLPLRRAARRQAHPGRDGEQGRAHRHQGAGGRRPEPPPAGHRDAEGARGPREGAREGHHAPAPAARRARHLAALVLDRQHRSAASSSGCVIWLSAPNLPIIVPLLAAFVGIVRPAALDRRPADASAGRTSSSTSSPTPST